MVYSVAQTIDRLAALPGLMDSLIKEVRPNGGTSLRDAIDKIGVNTTKLQTSVETLTLRNLTRWKMAYGVPSWEADAYGRCISANMELCELLQIPETDFLGWNWKNFIHPDDCLRVFADWRRIVDEKSDFHSSARYVTNEGQIVPVKLVAKAMALQGDVIGWIGVAERIAK